jgi:hypothetical protein
METTTTKGANFTVEGTYSSAILDKGTIVNLVLQSDISLKSKDKYVLIVLDISGSMSGSKLKTSLEAISEVIRMLFAHSETPKVDLITFTTRPTFYALQNKSCEECLNIVNGIKAGGGTCFIPVFDMIENILKQGNPEGGSLVTKAKNAVKGLFSGEASQSNNSKIDEFAVLFLSDGQAESLDKLQPYLTKLKTLASEKLSSAEFHTLGFGSDHDARLLEEMTKAMPTQGSFQYIKESVEITSSIEAVSDFLIEKRLTSSVKFGKDNQEKRVNFISKKDKPRAPGMESYWEAVVCLNTGLNDFEASKDNFNLAIKYEENYLNLVVPLVYKKAEGKSVEILQNCAFINEELKKISDAIISGSDKFDAKNAEGFRDQVAGFRVMLNELIRDIWKMKIDERKQAIESTKDLNEYMDKIGELLRAAANQGLTNDQIASINALAYRQVTKKSNLKTLDKRTLQNVDLLNQVSEKAKEIGQKTDEKQLSEKYKDLIEKIGCCALNLTNMAETLKAGDCLCITFDIGRPEVAIQDASRIIIKQIYPSIICASAFLDSIKYSMTLNPNNSGGFDTSFPGNIVKGASNETITAALPVYFCPEHWECASQYMKPILGWDVTVDPLGYDYNQVRTVPFLLLIKALYQRHDNPNEFNSRVVDWLLETCSQILKDEIASNAENNLTEKVKSIWEKYETDGTVRGVEVVQNSNVFLAYVYCLQHMDVLKQETQESFLKKARYMIEEEMRRRQDKAKVWNGSQIRKNIKKILNVDTEKYVEALKETEKPKEEQKTEETTTSDEPLEDRIAKFVSIYESAKNEKKVSYEALGKQDREDKNKEKAEENKENAEEKNIEFKFTVPQEFVEKLVKLGLKTEGIFPQEFDKLENVQKEYGAQALQSYEGAMKFISGWSKLMKFENPHLEKVQNIGLETPLQLFALHIQNKIHAKNSTRLEAFEKGFYTDAFNKQAAETYILNLAAQSIYDKWVKELNRKPKGRNLSQADLRLFIETEDLEVAAGIILKGMDLGSFEFFQEVLRKNPQDCKNVFEKLQMLKHKEYKGAHFDLDFVVRKKFLRQLSKKYQGTYSYDMWKELWFKEHNKQPKKNKGKGK